MLDKTKIKPGDRIKLLPILHNGLPKVIFGDSSYSDWSHEISRISVTGKESMYLAKPGDILTILEPPKRYQMGKMIKVKAPNGIEGFAFWCPIRASSQLLLQEELFHV